MTPFVHPLLLIGLGLIAIPIVIHLILRQQPKHQVFPAFRFLQQKALKTQTRLRLRHLLLLLLRILLIALIIVALARPRLLNQGLDIGTDSPVAAVMLFDTSPSMEYDVNKQGRLDEAKERAKVLLADLPENSKVAVFDSGDLGGEWAKSVNEARDQIDKLTIRPGNSPLTRQIAQAYRLLQSATFDGDSDSEPPRFLYVFSDLTQACWDENEARSLTQPDTVNAAVIDVGIREPVDVAVSAVDLSREVIAAGDRLDVRVTVRATGTDADTFVTCRVDQQPPEPKPVKLKAGTSEQVRFEVRTDDMKVGPHHVEVKLGSTDSLPFGDVRYATFEVRGDRKILVLTDKPDSARMWRLHAEATGVFRCEVKETSSAGALNPDDLLTQYRAICLFNVAQPDQTLWNMLEAYVQRGGKLAVVPGKNLNPEDYNLGMKVLPGKLLRPLVSKDEDASIPLDWNLGGRPHPLVAPFLEWKQTADVQFFKDALLPKVARYWDVEADGGVVLRYQDEANRPAVVERQVGQGRVLLFTTGFDGSKDAKDRWYWNNYGPPSSFLLVLVDKSLAYLIGDLERPSLNRLCGETVTVELPATPKYPLYNLHGPGLVGPAGNVTRPADQNEVQLAQAVAPGNYTLLDGANLAVTGFSLNVRADESVLDRVDVAKIDALLGTDSVVSVEKAKDLQNALKGHWKQPIELLPWLMIGLLLVLAAENLLANKFHRAGPDRVAEAGQQPVGRGWVLVGLLGRVMIGAGVGAAVGAAVSFSFVVFSPGEWSAMVSWSLLVIAGCAAGGCLVGLVTWALRRPVA